MIPDKSRESIADGAITVLGWQSCTDKRSFTESRFSMRWQRSTIFDLDTPF